MPISHWVVDRESGRFVSGGYLLSLPACDQRTQVVVSVDGFPDPARQRYDAETASVRAATDMELSAEANARVDRVIDESLSGTAVATISVMLARIIGRDPTPEELRQATEDVRTACKTLQARR